MIIHDELGLGRKQSLPLSRYNPGISYCSLNNKIHTLKMKLGKVGSS
jgi:hypothetical protein